MCSRGIACQRLKGGCCSICFQPDTWVDRLGIEMELGIVKLGMKRDSTVRPASLYLAIDICVLVAFAESVNSLHTICEIRTDRPRSMTLRISSGSSLVSLSKTPSRVNRKIGVTSGPQPGRRVDCRTDHKTTKQSPGIAMLTIANQIFGNHSNL